MANFTVDPRPHAPWGFEVIPHDLEEPHATFRCILAATLMLATMMWPSQCWFRRWRSKTSTSWRKRSRTTSFISIVCM
jgi:hypothetical protein